MRLPEIRRCRSRATVSTSGSSGIALELPPADVGSELLALKLDAPSGVETAALCVSHRGSHPRYAEHSSPRRDDATARVVAGTGMEYHHVAKPLRDADRRARARLLRITL